MLITIPEDSASIGRDHQPLTHSVSAPVQRFQHESLNRIRVIHLYRPPCGNYGFHLRGGREHETGFFISHVEDETEAYAQGLRIGDQLVRVNHMKVNHSLHKEVAAIVKHSSEVILEVKSAGFIPVKNNSNDQLSWMLVNNNDHLKNLSLDSQPTSLKSTSSSSSSSSSSLGTSLLIIHMKGAGKGTIGCSICKGPEEKPGIFVQKIHVGGIADEAGLRAGDQIFSCNGKSFLNIEFQEAVYHMKLYHCLKLEVLRGAGMDFIAGESSGYNSSISSEGDEASESECRTDKSYNLKSRMITRVNSLYLDSNRDWKEIEAEWAEAEVSEKRNKLTIYQGQEPKMSSSKSLLNISPIDKKTGSLKPTSVSKVKLERQSANIQRPKSMTNISHLNNKDTFKIAFQTAADPHVSKIIIPPPPPKDEKNAIMRLDLLSSNSTLKKTVSLPTTTAFDSKSDSIPSIYSSGSEYSDIGNNNARPLVKIQEKKTQTLKISNSGLKIEQRSLNVARLNRGRILPKECPKIRKNDSELNYPCSKICITSANGKYTSKVTIRSCPPAPPPRATSTCLTNERHPCSHRERHNSQQLSDSPPSSISSGSSHEYPKCDHNFNRQSTGSFSISSDESEAWEESFDHFTTNYSPSKNNFNVPYSHKSHVKVTGGTTVNNIIPIAPPPPPIPAQNTLQIPSSIPPPPPPPFPSVESKQPTNTASMNLNTALSNEIKARLEQNSNGLRGIKNTKIEQQKKPIPTDPNKQQHEKLMEEFKKAHAQMFSKKIIENIPESTDIIEP